MSPRPTWSDDHLHRLCEAVGDGITFAAIVPLLGRTRSALIGKFDRLLKETAHWTQPSIDMLCDLIADGLGFDEIGTRMGVSSEAVAARFAFIRKSMGCQAR